MLQDLKYAAKGILRRPAHTALVVFTLALGLGINTVAFSSVNALVFRPFQVAGSDTYGWLFVGNAADPLQSSSRETYDAIRTQATTLEAIVAEGRLPLSAQSDAGPEQVWALTVSPNYFSVVPAPMRRGRPLTERDLTTDAVPILISERYWKSRWNSEDLASIRPVLNGQRTSVLGVVRDDFQGPGGLFSPHLWFAFDALPALRLNPGGPGNPEWLTLMARPRAGASASQISAEVLSIARGLSTPTEQDEVRAQYVPIIDGHPEARQLGTAAALGMAAVGLVLLIACFNVAGLILARSVERQQELGLRAALGAGRGRLTRLLLAEGLIVATLAGGAALLLATWSEALLGSLSLPAPIPQRLVFTTDWRMVGFTGFLVVIAAVVPALTPTWRITRIDPIKWLKAGNTGAIGAASPARARKIFVQLQVAGSTVFLTLAMVFVASFVSNDRRDPGFNTTHTAVMQISPSSFVTTPERQRALVQDFLDRVGARPEVAHVAAAERISFNLGSNGGRSISTDGKDCTGGGCPTMPVTAVAASFFEAMEIPLLAGRGFTPNERDTVIVNEPAARELWGDRSALGQWLTAGANDRPRQVIAVAASVVVGSMSETPKPYVYVPLTSDHLASPVSIVVRSRTNGDAAAQVIRDVWRALDDTLPPTSVQTMEERMALPLWPSRVSAAFFATCGIVAVILVTVGLFGVTFQLVNQRTREFGVRLALGATASGLRNMIVGESLRLIWPGLLVGLILAGAATSASTSMLVGISALDPRVYAAALILQVLVAAAASWMPALRASRVSPQRTMRAE